MKNKKGFTLLELLVVVLIIGILAAVALPQYKLAVEKSHIAQVLSAIRTIARAQELFYIVNERYANDISELDVDISTPEGWILKFYNDNTYHKVHYNRYIGNSYIEIISYYTNCGEICIHPGMVYCWASKNDNYGQKICSTAAKTKGYVDGGGIRWVFG